MAGAVERDGSAGGEWLSEIRQRIRKSVLTAAQQPSLRRVSSTVRRKSRLLRQESKIVGRDVIEPKQFWGRKKKLRGFR